MLSDYKQEVIDRVFVYDQVRLLIVTSPFFLKQMFLLYHSLLFTVSIMLYIVLLLVGSKNPFSLELGQYCHS